MRERAWWSNAKPTVLRGIRYRSKLESVWAAYFYALGMQVHYEPRRFYLGDTTYLPDFWLVGEHTYVEVKGSAADMTGISKAKTLARACADPIGIPVVLALAGHEPRDLLTGVIPPWYDESSFDNIVMQIVPGTECKVCGGDGHIACMKCGGSGRWGDYDNLDCFGCDASGSWSCRYCRGNGGFGWRYE